MRQEGTGSAQNRLAVWAAGRILERAVALVHDGFEFISYVALGKLLHFSVT